MHGWAWKGGGILVILGCAGGYFLRPQHAQAVTEADSNTLRTPVVVTTVTRRDMPVELKGLGTVQANNTVTVKPQVSGQITEIAFVEGQFIRKGAVLARLDSRYLLAQVHQTEANRAKDEAQLENARRDLVRLTDIAAKGFASRQLVDAQQSQVAVLQAAVQADQAAIENAKVQLDYATVTAPIDGITGIRMVDVGNNISPTDPGLVVITQVRPIAVIFTLPADVASTIAMGQVHDPLPVEAFNRDDNIKLTTGTLALLDNQIDRNSNTVRLKAIFENADGALRPGEFVNAHLRKDVLRNATVVPKSVIQYDEQGAFAWIVRADSTVEPRRVALGPASGGLVTVESGLSAGDQVVVDGQYSLRTGAAVTAKMGTAAAPRTDISALTIP